jgi:hypothetical protein
VACCTTSSCGSTKQVAAEALARLPVADIMIEEPPVEQISREVFRQEVVDA